MIDKYCKIRNDIYNLNKNQIKIKNNDNKLILKQMLYKNIDIYAYIFYKYITYKMQIAIFKYLTKNKILLLFLYIGMYINYLYTYKNNLIIPYKIIE